MILICGANGTIGSRVVTQLTNQSFSVRGLVRKLPASRPDPLLEYVTADLLQPETLEAIFADVESAFLLSPVSEHQLQMEQNFVKAAVSHNVRRIVKLSVLKAGVDSAFTFGRIHGQIEQQIAASPCEWTFLRPNMLMQNLFWYKDALTGGVLPLALAQAPVSHVDAEDVASVAVVSLTDKGHTGMMYDLTGPQSLTGDQVAAVLSAQFEKPVQYVPISLQVMREELTKNGTPAFDIDAECDLFDLWSKGSGNVLSESIQQITGREPTSLEQFTTRERSRLMQVSQASA